MIALSPGWVPRSDGTVLGSAQPLLIRLAPDRIGRCLGDPLNLMPGGFGGGLDPGAAEPLLFGGAPMAAQRATPTAPSTPERERWRSTWPVPSY
jgi:hypothetical protein